MVATVARYHGGARPRKRRDDGFAALRQAPRRTVRWLSAMLRIAEGLDRSHYQLVRGVIVRRRREKIVLVADAKRQAQLEVWAGRRRAADLARLIGMSVGVSTAGADAGGGGDPAGGRSGAARGKGPARRPPGARARAAAADAPASIGFGTRG